MILPVLTFAAGMGAGYTLHKFKGEEIDKAFGELSTSIVKGIVEAQAKANEMINKYKSEKEENKQEEVKQEEVKGEPVMKPADSRPL